MDEYDHYPNVKIHLKKDLKQEFVLNSDGSWNIWCNIRPPSGHIKFNIYPEKVTCKRCLKAYVKTQTQATLGVSS